MLDYMAFAIFPYVAISIELVVSIYRYYSNSYKFSSLSSEFLESNQLFWGSVPWHYGILGVLAGHLLAFCFPKEFIAFGSVPVRLFILELTALVFGLLSLFGLILLLKRRLTNDRIRVVTSNMDILVLVLLLIQVASGVGIAITCRWGSMWYASSMVPYLKSVFTFAPNLGFIKAMPFIVKVHVFNAFLLIAILPFTRLVHFLVLPVHYIWRSWQVVIWNYDRKSIRKTDKN